MLRLHDAPRLERTDITSSPHVSVPTNAMSHRADVAIVGAGIMGLAHAYAAAVRGLKVVVFERSGQASGASVRNFGMIWPVAQPHGRLHQLALRSRAHWLDILAQAKLPYRSDGSLLLAYAEDEAE